MVKAIEVITSAYERCNRLSPGETLNADDAAFGLRRLNEFVDELAAQNAYLFRAVLTSAAQSGQITLGAGAWASLSPGDEVVSATANNLKLSEVTMQQYNELYQPNVTGTPTVWAQDGLSTVYLWPVPVGQTIKLMTRATVSNFADQVTDYVMPDGYKAFLSAGLAVRIAPNILGRLPAELVRAEARLAAAVDKYEPAIISVESFTGGPAYFPPRLF